MNVTSKLAGSAVAFAAADYGVDQEELDKNRAVVSRIIRCVIGRATTCKSFEELCIVAAGCFVEHWSD